MKYSQNHCTGWSSEGEQEPGCVEEEATEVVVEEEEPQDWSMVFNCLDPKDQDKPIIRARSRNAYGVVV